jgi:flagellar M-ring protein FliF
MAEAQATQREFAHQLAGVRDALLRLGPAKLAGLGAAALVVLGLVAWVALGSGEPMGLLYSGLDPAQAGEISQKLEEMKISAEARGDGTSLYVPVSQVARARMQLAAAGLPRQGGAGYELLDNQSPMNMTSFMQRVQRLRALEGELARTILALDGVHAARVHLVLPERETFAREAPPATASIIVTMLPGRHLSASQAAAVRLLVAGAVPRLKQENVSIVDPSGVVLAAEGGDALAASRLGEMKSAREQAVQRAVLDLLEPLVGRGHVRAVAAVELDPTRESSREERFDPLSQVERSRQTNTEQESSEETRPRQPVTIGQNLPTEQVGSNPNHTDSKSSRHGETVNYELSSTLDERVREPGTVKRLTVAVVVDGRVDAKGQFQPRAREELDKLAELVRSAVGFDAKRGDRVTVDTMRFVPEDAADGTAAQAGALGAGRVSHNSLILAALLVLVVAATGGWFGLRAYRRAARAKLDLARPPIAGAVPAALAQPPVGALTQSPAAALAELVDDRFEESVAVLRTWIAEQAPG